MSRGNRLLSDYIEAQIRKAHAIGPIWNRNCLPLRPDSSVPLNISAFETSEEKKERHIRTIKFLPNKNRGHK